LTNVLFKHGTTNVMTTTKVYDNLNQLTSISSVTSVSSVVVSSHTYLYNSANQRIKATLQDGSYWEYAYDSLGQVTNAVKKWPDNVLVAGQQFGYAYDSIGNRTSAKSGGDQNGVGLRTSTYTANSLNQYTQRTVPDAFDVIGSAQSNATVTVNNLATYRKADYFWKELAVTNSSSAQFQPVSVVGVKNNVGTNQEDAVTTVTGNEFVPKTPEAFSYDLDGNQTSDGRWNYTWDAENRLTKIESLTSAPSASKRKVEWTYDYQGRKVRQTTHDGSSGSYVVTGDLKFVYDAWHNLAELNATNNAVLRSYVWGLDLSGTTDGAGGVGGLLLLNSTANGVHFTAMDGNGNVVALLSADSGQQTASYEYSPFGETLRSVGSMAKENPYRFSTKRTEDTTQFIPYDFRTYRTDIGRWLSRDPIGEDGGVALYVHTQNSPVNFFDAVGLAVNLSPKNGRVVNQSERAKVEVEGDYVEMRFIKSGVAMAIYPYSQSQYNAYQTFYPSLGWVYLGDDLPHAYHSLDPGHDTVQDWINDHTKIVDADFVTRIWNQTAGDFKVYDNSKCCGKLLQIKNQPLNDSHDGKVGKSGWLFGLPYRWVVVRDCAEHSSDPDAVYLTWYYAYIVGAP